MKYDKKLLKKYVLILFSSLFILSGCKREIGETKHVLTNEVESSGNTSQPTNLNPYDQLSEYILKNQTKGNDILGYSIVFNYEDSNLTVSCFTNKVSFLEEIIQDNLTYKFIFELYQNDFNNRIHEVCLSIYSKQELLISGTFKYSKNCVITEKDIFDISPVTDTSLMNLFLAKVTLFQEMLEDIECFLKQNISEISISDFGF